MLDGRRVLASVLICQGCCCGHPEKGNPEIPRAQLEAAWRERRLEGAVRLRFVDCIGPCEPANLAVIKLPEETVWLAGLDGAPVYDALTDWAEQSRDGGLPAALSAALAERQIPAPRDDVPD
jgi:cobaltochelatase CobN